MSDALTTALRGIETIDSEQATRLLAAFAAIREAGDREDVIAFAEALANMRHRH